MCRFTGEALLGEGYFLNPIYNLGVPTTIKGPSIKEVYTRGGRGG